MSSESDLAWLPVVSVVMVALIFACGLFVPRGWNWFLVMLLMIAFIALIGKLVTKHYSGALIDDRKKMSLARFQLLVWTVIVLSAFLTIALERIYAGESDPLAIAIPPQLWALLGISATSFVGAPAILSTKKKKEPTDTAKDKIALLLVEQGRAPDKDTAKKIVDDNVKIFGTLSFNADISKANFSNMFTGDEQMNENLVDMAKVQKFFFTLIIAFSYMVLLAQLIMKTDASLLTSFPALDDSLVALLGISSAGYLTDKVYDHTKTK